MVLSWFIHANIATGWCVLQQGYVARNGLDPSMLYCYLDVLRNKFSRLEMVMYLLSVVAANSGCGCYRVGGARGAQTR